MTNQDKKVQQLTELAKLSPFELSVLLAKAERMKAQALAKAETQRLKKSGSNNRPRGYGPHWGTPLNLR